MKVDHQAEKSIHQFRVKDVKYSEGNMIINVPCRHSQRTIHVCDHHHSLPVQSEYGILMKGIHNRKKIRRVWEKYEE